MSSFLSTGAKQYNHVQATRIRFLTLSFLVPIYSSSSSRLALTTSVLPPFPCLDFSGMDPLDITSTTGLMEQSPEKMPRLSSPKLHLIKLSGAPSS